LVGLALDLTSDAFVKQLPIVEIITLPNKGQVKIPVSMRDETHVLADSLRELLYVEGQILSTAVLRYADATV